jgi:uncharacterized RDD family membrane protein YckC
MTRYHTFGRRLIAAIIDGLVFLPLIVLNVWIFEAAEVSDWIYFALLVVQAVLGLAYNILLHWKYGQTIGKMVTKVQVLDISETPVSLRQAWLRDVAYIIEGTLRHVAMLSLFWAGYTRTSDLVVTIEQYSLIPLAIWVGIDTLVCLKSKKFRALHDFIAGTIVVRLDVPSNPDRGMHYEPPGPELYEDLRNTH